MRLSTGEPAYPCHVLRAPPSSSHVSLTERLHDEAESVGRMWLLQAYAASLDWWTVSYPPNQLRPIKERRCEPRRLSTERLHDGGKMWLLQGYASLDW